MYPNPVLFEVNTRIWLKKFNNSFLNVTDDYIIDLRDKGIDILWLMGVWKNCSSIIEQNCFSNDLVTSYNKSLKDWNKEDVYGSPYSVDVYELSPDLGNIEDLILFKHKLNQYGIKLILDFIPNHFGADTKYLNSNPDIFLPSDYDSNSKDSYTFFEHDGKYFAHGRDPLFPAWSDTVQVNYFNEKSRSFMVDILMNISKYCDGVRCDMAMLPLNNVFNNTWIGIINKFNFSKPKEEFWSLAIKKIKEKNPSFFFLAEAYWDLEWDLQQLGFDFTYDKRLLERLVYNDIAGVIAHLKAEKCFQQKSARFIENHDELRAVSHFGKMKSLAAAVVMSTIVGLKLYYDGQFEGKRVKLPVQLSREPQERISNTVQNFYKKLLKITSEEIFRIGNWHLLEPFSSGNGNTSFESFFAWYWNLDKNYRVVIINYSEKTAQCRIKLNLPTSKNDILFSDLLNDEAYLRSAFDMRTEGLYIELKAFSSHIFKIEL